jgi:hypothetical protein
MDRISGYIKFTLPLFLGLVIVSCKIEEAKPEISKKLVIASDFLEPKDTTLFIGFSKKYAIHVEILNLSAEKIAQRLEKDVFNSSIDLVFVKSLQSVKILKNIQFQKLNSIVLREKTPFLKVFKNNNWLVAGLDPFVFSCITDSSKTAKTYSDLTNNFSWASPQSIDEFTVLLAHRDMHSKKDAEWKNRFIKNNEPFNTNNYSISNTQFLVVKNSFLVKNKFLKNNEKRVIFFPKENNQGCYADRWCIAIVDQAKNYESAQAFLMYYSRLPLSNIFNKQYGIIPGFIGGNNPDILNIDEDLLLKNMSH